MKKYIFLIVTIILSACSICKISKTSPIKEIQFGNGGGFTGEVTTYTLKSNGTLWMQDKKIDKLSCDSLNSIYELAERIPKENYIRPDNTYSFIKIIMKDKTYYYTWSWGNSVVKEITELYTKLNKQL